MMDTFESKGFDKALRDLRSKVNAIEQRQEEILREFRVRELETVEDRNIGEVKTFKIFKTVELEIPCYSESWDEDDVEYVLEAFNDGHFDYCAYTTHAEEVEEGCSCSLEDFCVEGKESVFNLDTWEFVSCQDL